MTGATTGTLLIVAGLGCIGAFLWTLTNPDVPRIWIGGVFVGVYLIYRGAIYHPRVKGPLDLRTNREDRQSPINKDYQGTRPYELPQRTIPRMAQSRVTGLGHGRAGRVCVMCSAPIEREWLACPTCGVDYREVCRFCGQRIERDWIACPNCGSEF